MDRHAKLVLFVLLLAGVGIPLVFGAITTKAMNLGIGTLLEKSTDTNRSYITGEVLYFGNNKSLYDLTTETIVDTDFTYVLLQEINYKQAISQPEDNIRISYYLNASLINEIDKVIVYIQNADGIELPSKVRIELRDTDGDQIFKTEQEINTSTLQKIEVTLSPIDKLRLDTKPQVFVWISANNTNVEFLNTAWQFRLEIYDVEKVNTNSIANIMLAASGIVMIVGAFFATPWINPSKRLNRRRWRR